MSETESPQLSKNQQKRLKKREKYLEKKQLKKETKVRRKQPSSIRKKKKLVHISSYKVVLDLEFEKLMTDKELVSTIAQIQYCYADNRNREIGLDLYCTSMSEHLGKLLGERCKDYLNWKMTFTDSHFVQFFNEQGPDALDQDKLENSVNSHGETLGDSVLDNGSNPEDNSTENCINAEETAVKEKDKLPEDSAKEPLKFCYLTADSPNEITTLSTDTIYIIGALVDHNRYKNLCFEKAKELQIDHARLPISSFIKMQSRKVLTINHVVGILSRYINCHDWEGAFLDVIPQRKGAQKKNMNTNEQPENTDTRDQQATDTDEDQHEESNTNPSALSNITGEVKVHTDDGHEESNTNPSALSNISGEAKVDADDGHEERNTKETKLHSE